MAVGKCHFGEYRSCNITINGETFYNVGIRPKGNSSLSQIARSDSKRFSFKLDFSEYIDGQTYYGAEKIVLNNIMSDKTYMKEYLSYKLFDFMGVPSSACAYSNIRINGKDWGLYLAVEVIDESYIERHFGSVNGNLYKPEAMEIGGDRGEERGGQQNGGPNAMPFMRAAENRCKMPPERNRGKMKPGENKCQSIWNAANAGWNRKRTDARQTGKRGDIK